MSNRSIVDNVVDRLKQQPVGDLITEEDLYEIVKEAIPKVFFEERKVVDGSGYNARTVTKPPLIYDVMKEVLTEHVKTFVKEWTVENSDKILQHWKEVTDENIVSYVEKIQKEKINAEVKHMLSSFMTNFNNERVKMGLPYISL